MKLKCRVNQRECLRQGLPAPKTKTVEVDLDALTKDERAYILNHVDDGMRFPSYPIWRCLPSDPPPSICPADLDGVLAWVRDRLEKEGGPRETYYRGSGR